MHPDLKADLQRRFSSPLLRDLDLATLARAAERYKKLESRRLRRIRIGFPLWSGMLRGALCPTSRISVPDDLEVMGIYTSNLWWGDVDVVVWSSTFEPIQEGAEEVPLIEASFSVEYLTIPSDRTMQEEEDETLAEP
jgi:hypothetical protein